MRRSHRLALSAGCALAVLVAAGRLAGDLLSRAGAGSAAAAARASGEAARVAEAASQHGGAALAHAGERDAAGDARVANRLAPFAASAAQALRARDAGSAKPIVLDDPQPALGSAVAIHGSDPAAPREIELWRLADGRAARVATGRSRSDGSLDLPALVLPAGEVLLVASPRGAGPNTAAASLPVRTSRDPSPPRLVARGEAIDASGSGALLSLQLEPAEPGGEIVVARSIAALDGGAASQVEALRAPVAADGAPTRLDLLVALEPGDTEVRIAQQLEDGRRSPWRSVVLSDLPKENDDVDAVADELQP